MSKTSKYVLETSRDYSLYVCGNRAVPAATDGLKDSQRKALWLMKSKTDKIKVISLAGEMISSNMYLHGDASASDAISKLAAPYLNNNPLLEGKGAFGTKVDPQAIASPRYVYVKKSKFLDNVVLADLDIVPMKENYDGSVMEPVTFLPLIPTVLLNGISGIAVGWSTEILPHKFEDLKKAVMDVIEGKDLTEGQLVPGMTYNNSTVTHVDGNSWLFSGVIKELDASTIEVVELPPEISLEKFRERLDKLEEDKKIRSYTDESAKEISVKINVGRGLAKSKTTEQWIDFFKLRSKKSQRIVVLDWDFSGIVQYSNPEELVVDFVKWRFTKYVERFNMELKNSEDDVEFWKLVQACYDNDLTSKIGNLAGSKELENLVSSYKTDAKIEHVRRIVNYPTYRWTKEFRQVSKSNMREAQTNVKRLQTLLKSESEMRKIFLNEVKELK